MDIKGQVVHHQKIGRGMIIQIEIISACSVVMVSQSQ